MNRLNKLDVFYHDRPVGTLALYQNRLAAFEYDSDWIMDGFSISPFSLPLQKKVFMPKTDPFEGLFGVFADSLPDGWGRLLVDRLMRKKEINPYEIGNLERLAIVGNSGMGALTYRPAISIENGHGDMGVDEIAKECERILNTESSDNLDYLFAKGGSSGGARPKILTRFHDEDWIIKFPSSDDSKDVGKQEYDYALCAVECGLEMEKVRLFPSEKTKGYFGTRRFDRVSDGEYGKIHMVSVAGLLETSHRIPNLDYDTLMQLTLQLTKSMEECEKLYKLMCFNVFSHNRDDHSKNFTFIYRESEKKWELSPAYDLTYSSSIGGEHATTVNGNGINPGMDDILAVAKKIGLNITKAKKTASNIRECVFEMLDGWIR
ncbi:MAG: type II toxin-antitoxin system HipA family toxin [Lachnospiraceae bacterium]|nr:type II toxin-antitoxin system HipA family toxin [Lachnospiraceae bacterium]